MSHHIYYRFLASRVPGAALTDGIDRFFICIQGGDSNCYDHSGPTARRSRNWRVKMLGTLEDILEQACYYAVECETGDLKIQGKACTPESYIKKIRNLVEKASTLDASIYAAPVALAYNCQPGDPDEILLSSKGVPKTDGKTYYETGPEACFKFLNPDGTPDFRTFFEVYPHLTRNPWAWAFQCVTCPDLI